MKKRFKTWLIMAILSNCFIIKSAIGQSPQAIPYQAIARDASGNLLSSQNVSLRLTLHDVTAAGTILYREIQNITTNSLGLFSINFGQGTPITGTLPAVNWASGAKFLQVELDPNGGTSYVNMGTTQLMSVPYALFAANSGNLPNGTGNGNTMRWNGTVWIADNTLFNNGSNIGIGTTDPTQQLHTTGGVRHQSLSGSGPRTVMVDANGNLFTQSQVPGSTTTSSGGNQPIPDFGCASGNGLSNTITLSGLPASFNSSLISVTVNINASYSNDFVLFLQAPNGQILRLAQNVGGSGGGFSNTTFTDAAPTFISSGSTPFNGSFKPSGGTSTTCSVTPTVTSFTGFGGGSINPNGTWTLKIYDNISFIVGSFVDWSVNVAAYSDPPISNYVPKWNGSSLSSSSSIYDNGNVGIGTNNPTKKLTVTGDILVNGCPMGRGNSSIASNVAIGNNTLNVNSTGFSNTALGSDALTANAGGYANTGIGAYALETNVSGYKNTAIGYGAGVGSSGLANATAIGADAMVTQSNSLILGSINGLNGAAASAFIGIGTTAPQAPLHVAGPGITTPTLARGYFNWSTGGSIQNNTSSSGNILIRADGYFWANAGGFVATSDKRIKNKIGLTNNQKDLADLNKIEITNYKYIDEMAQGSKVHKKVIAQHLNSVYPLAVDTNQGVIPNVFETAKSIKLKDEVTIIETNKAHDFKTGDEVKLILENAGEKIVTVTVIDEHSFSVNEKIEHKIFVYGKKVNDLLIVDYDALTTLNISATQELSRQIETLKAENRQLRNEMKQQWQKMEAALNNMRKEENTAKQ